MPDSLRPDSLPTESGFEEGALPPFRRKPGTGRRPDLDAGPDAKTLVARAARPAVPTDHGAIAPPRNLDDALVWLQLIRSHRIGPHSFFRLLQDHGTAQSALQALPGIASDAGLSDYAPCTPQAATREYEAGRAFGARLLARGGPGYPACLADIADAPPLLWAVGNTDLCNRPAIALVGARNASALGQRMARVMAKGLGESGQVIVSGLARGVDAAAHTASLASGTIAVFAGGIDVVYPTENRALALQIAENGLCLSEQPPALKPQARHFPRRNRLISGIAQAVVVVEAALRSGSLITARVALDQGRDVMAVPGHPFDARAGGCNQLIRDGAALVRGPKDVLANLGAPPRLPTDPAPPRRKTSSNTGLSRAILAALSASPVAEDTLAEVLNAAPDALSQTLTELELADRITREPGGFVAKVTGAITRH